MKKLPVLVDPRVRDLKRNTVLNDNDYKTIRNMHMYLFKRSHAYRSKMF